MENNEISIPNISSITNFDYSNMSYTTIEEETNYIFQCKNEKCVDSPRIIIDSKNNKLLIRLFCLFHKDEEEEYVLNNSIDFFNSKFLKDVNQRKYQDNSKCMNCDIHSSQYIKYCVTDDNFICQYCDEDENKEYEIISDLITIFESKNDIETNKCKRIYLNRNLKEVDKHISFLKKKYFQFKINEINDYIEINKLLLLICKAIYKTYTLAYNEGKVTYSMIKNISELNFSIFPLPNCYKKEKAQLLYIPYLNNINNNIITHHLKEIRTKKIIENGKIYSVKKLNEKNKERNRLILSVKNYDNEKIGKNKNEIYIVDFETFNIDFNINEHKHKIRKIEQLEDNIIISLSKDKCIFIQINDNKYEIINNINQDEINGEIFYSFTLHKDYLIAFQTNKKIYIYNIQNKRFLGNIIENHSEYLNTKPELFTNPLEYGFYFYTFINNIFIEKVWNYSNESINFKQIEYGIHYSGNNSSLATFRKIWFLIGGKENSGFYINKFEDHKNFANIIPNKFAFDCLCVTKEESIVSGESYNNKEFAIRRYQVISRVSFTIDTILFEKDITNNKLKGKINCIICLDDNSILAVNGKGNITLYN